MNAVRQPSAETAEAVEKAAAAEVVLKYIRRAGSKWKVYSEAGDVLGTHDTREEAAAQLAAVEAHKHGTAKAEDPTAEVVETKAEDLPGETNSQDQSTTGPGEAVLKAEQFEMLKDAFLEWATGEGIVTKAIASDVAFELREDGIVRVEHALGHKYFAVTEIGATALPWDFTLKGTSFVQVQKSEGEEKRYTLGVVYPHGEVDFHKDSMTEDEVEKAAWRFMAQDGVHGRVGLMHAPGTDGAGRVVESYIYRGPEYACKSAGDATQEQTIKPGDWLMGVVWSPEAWAKVKSGNVTGYSLQGVARKVE